MTAGVRRGRGRPTDARGDETRRRVVSVAISVFAEHGYARGGMRAIADEAGVTASALYNYFPSKASLYGAAWAVAMGEVYDEYESAVAGQDSLADELHAVIERAAVMIRERPWIPTFGLSAALDAARPDLRDHLPPPTSVGAFLRSLSARALERGEIDDAERRLLETYVSVLLWGISAVSRYDERALTAAVEAARWSVEKRFVDPSPAR